MAENRAHPWSATQIRGQRWFAMPKSERDPKTQEGLAAELGISDRTLSRWKQLPGWQEAVNDLARANIRDALPEVFGALIREAVGGSFAHIRLVLEMAGEYQERTKTEISGAGGEPIRLDLDDSRAARIAVLLERARVRRDQAAQQAAAG